MSVASPQETVTDSIYQKVPRRSPLHIHLSHTHWNCDWPCVGNSFLKMSWRLDRNLVLPPWQMDSFRRSRYMIYDWRELCKIFRLCPGRPLAESYVVHGAGLINELTRKYLGQRFNMFRDHGESFPIHLTYNIFFPPKLKSVRKVHFRSFTFHYMVSAAAFLCLERCFKPLYKMKVHGNVRVCNNMVAQTLNISARYLL